MPKWTAAAALVRADVGATTDLRPEWHVVLHEVGEPPKPRGDAWDGLVQAGLVPALEASRLPYVTLDDGEREGFTLWHTDDVTTPRAVGAILSEIQDDMIERVQSAWSQCRRWALRPTGQSSDRLLHRPGRARGDPGGEVDP